MKRMNQIIAFILSFVLLLTSGNTTNLFYATEVNESKVSTDITNGDELIVEGTNSFGTLFANTLATEMTEQEENNGCNVFSVEIIDNVAEVTFETTEYAQLVVGIYDELGITMLASGSTEVMQEDTKVYVDIDIDTMPEYFCIRAFLVDEESMRPLCTVYESSMYTQEMQEFLQKTIDDFDEDKVLNLDEDKTNNFAVYSDETIIIPESDEDNKVIQSYGDNNTYTFENIDSHIANLQVGDIFAYQYNDGEVLIVKVASIIIDGTTAIITGEDTSMEEVFDYVKIDENSDTQDIKVDESTCEEGVVYEGDVEMEDEEDTPETYAFDAGGSVSYAKKFSFLDKELDEDTKLSGSIELKIEASVKLYIAKDSQYMEVKLDYKAKAGLAFSGELEERKLPLAYFEVSPVPGVYIKFTPSIVAEVSAKIDLNTQLYGTIGFRASAQEGMKNLTTTPKFKAEIKGEITVFVGLSMEPQVTIITEKLADASLDVKAGAEAKGTTVHSTESDKDSKSKKIHECTSCIDGDITAKASVEFKANIFDSDKLSFKLKGAFSIKIADFYFSFDYADCDLTSCPHYKYKVTFNVVEGTGKILENAKVKVEGTTITTLTEDGIEKDVTELHVDKNGRAEGYLSSGKYKAIINMLGYNSVNKKVIVEDDAVSVWVWMKVSSGENAGSGSGNEESGGGNGDTGENEGNGIKINRGNRFSLGDGNVGVITEDGSLYMWGLNLNGQIGNGYTEVQNVPIKVLENVVSVMLSDRDSMYLSAAITEDGSLYMWGENSCGQIGNGTTENQLVPVKILDNVVQCSWNCNCVGAVTENGDLYMWGENSCGQIGNGTIENQLIPIKVLDDVTEVIMGAVHSGAITEDGSLYMWGANSCGQIGNGTTEDQLTPLKILDNVVEATLEELRVEAITEDGSLYMWGLNDDGQIGNGTTENQLTPLKILDNVVQCSSTTDTVGAVTKDGNLYMWGENDYGQVGNGTKSRDQLIPIKVLDNVAEIVLGDFTVGAITKDGSLYMWGANNAGQIGNETRDDPLFPIKVLDDIAEVILDDGYTGAITKDGSLYMWGSDVYGAIGDGSGGFVLSPIKILNNVIEMICRNHCVGAITKDGSLYMWGSNAVGEGGNGSTDIQLTRHKVMDNVKIDISIQDSNVQEVLLTNYNSIQFLNSETTFIDLFPNEIYNFYVMKDQEREEPFNSTNLLYITQAVSDVSGTLTVSYIPTELVDTANVFVVQISQNDLSSAQVGLADLKYSGEQLYVNPVVTLNDTILVEGKDYVLSGDYSVLEKGEYTVTVQGIGLYTGRINVSYKVFGTNEYTLDIQNNIVRGYTGDAVDVIIPDGVTTIGNNAFRISKSLMSIQLPSTLTDIRRAAFQGCENLVAIEIPTNVTEIQNYAFMDCVRLTNVVLPLGITEINTAVFDGCVNLKTVVLPDTLMKVGESAFNGCTNLENIEIPSSVMDIGNFAFLKCENLSHIKIPSGVTNIGTQTFYNCSALTKIEIPKSVSSIGEDCFTGCDELTIYGKAGSYAELYANENEIPFVADTVVITFDANGGSDLSIETKEVVEGMNIGSLPSVQREGYFFKGWYTSATGGEKVTENTIITSDITFYAQWEKDVISIENATVNFQNSFVYDGTEKKPTVIVTLGGKNLSQGTDYTVSYSDCVEAGSATITIIGTGNYSGSLTRTYTILRNSLSANGKVTLSGTSFVYDGTAIKPSVTVTCGNKTLSEGSEYTVSYANNTATGTATVTITGVGNYCESVNTTFTISKADISKADVTLSAASFLYDGTAKQPSTVVKLGNKALVSGTDYTVSYANNTAVGTATVTITGKGNYTGCVNKTFTIGTSSIEGASITLSATSYVYDGTAKQPTVAVKLGDKTLVLGTDYTVSYTNNTTVGTATVIITGKGNYAGTISKTYTIISASIQGAKVTLSKTSYDYDGKAKEPSVTVMVGDKKLGKDDYSVSYKNNKNIGTATVTITGKGNYTGTITQTFTIKLDKGDVFTSGKYKYKVTGSSTVAFNGIASTKTTKVSIPKTVTYGGKTFKVTSVADKALKGKTKVTQITIGANVTKIGASAFAGCTKLTKVTMGSNVTSIGSSAFKGCTKLTKVSMGKKVKTVGVSAFENCKKLSTVTIGSAVTTIDDKAFKNCTALKSITIPSKVTKIDKQAFYGCKNLKTITIKSTKLKTVGKEAFKKINSKASIKVPKSKLKSYQKLLKGKGQGSKVKIVKY